MYLKVINICICAFIEKNVLSARLKNSLWFLLSFLFVANDRGPLALKSRTLMSFDWNGWRNLIIGLPRVDRVKQLSLFEVIRHSGEKRKRINFLCSRVLASWSKQYVCCRETKKKGKIWDCYMLYTSSFKKVIRPFFIYFSGWQRWLKFRW